MGWQWHQLDHMQIIWTSLQKDNHASTCHHSVFTGRMPFLPPNQQRQSTEGIHVKQEEYIRIQHVSSARFTPTESVGVTRAPDTVGLNRVV